MEDYYQSSTWSDAENRFNFSDQIGRDSSFVIPWTIQVDGVAEDKTSTVYNSHRQAEKRRRDRINAQLSALRKLIPMSDKMDKAALLKGAVEQVKDLKRKAAEISKASNIPTEMDEVTVDWVLPEDISPNNTRQVMGSSRDKIFIRASVCCDDQPQVFTELIKVLKGLRLNTIKADISSVGGRMKSNLILCCNSVDEEGFSPTTLKQSLNVVLSRIASPSDASNARIRSKRQRLFLLSQFTQ
ncbi:Differentiation-associated protein 1, putative isoform 1 [Hibiscus syriacus]|uniref:Differentiation-associated protein 1, putative isoform 1 n=1 Tax=Hibiscus syriacus TaxID=106335 RepID=A0A6A3C8J5_HIBSY|nr:transcription factor bHLH51-like [Hibiscus syriacus]KAE8723369.1 Differentiation-associated protein 1, putative isoform 1 [Hibiscus syriacus]